MQFRECFLIPKNDFQESKIQSDSDLIPLCRNMMKRRQIIVNDLMQKHYTYYLSELRSNELRSNRSELTPKQMLEMRFRRKIHDGLPK